MQKFHVDWFNIFTINAEITSDFKFTIFMNIYYMKLPPFYNDFLFGAHWHNLAVKSFRLIYI